jgi:outer membrane biogenesis lipoprotein LolB
MRTRTALAIAAALLTACTAARPATPSASPTVSPMTQVAATPLPSGRGTWTADAGITAPTFTTAYPVTSAASATT